VVVPVVFTLLDDLMLAVRRRWSGGQVEVVHGAAGEPVER